MFVQLLPNSYSHNSVIYEMEELPRDFRRILRIQFKEFLHWLEEKPLEQRDSLGGGNLKDIA